MNIPTPPRLGIIGTGRVGQTLGIAAYEAGYHLTAVYNHTPASARALAARTKAKAVGKLPQVIAQADLVLIAVPDDTIAEIDKAGAQFWRAGMGVVHHSGLHPASVLEHAAAAGALIGTMHPLQSISDPHTGPERLTGAYFGLSGHPQLLSILQTLVLELGGHPLTIPDEAKPRYHAAAVFASNYLVTCFAQAVQLFNELGIDSDEAVQALLPLARGAVSNLQQPGLPDALTGPLSRGDVGTILTHQVALARHCPQRLPLYQALARASLDLVAAQDRLSPETLSQLIHALQPSRGP